MTSDPDDGTRPVQAGTDGRYSVDARGGMGVQVGEGNTQIIYTYNRLTWTDGVAPPPLVSVSGAVDSPYRGLAAFEEQDAAFFFGREETATGLLDRMSRLLAGPGLLVVSGASGAGKSSLLRAGVLPRIRGAGLASAPGAASWPCLVFTPGRAPLDELALRVAVLAGADAASVRRGLDADPGGFALTVRQAALAPPPGVGGESGGPTTRLLIVVDQFEQVFTQCADDGQRRAFITALCSAAGVESGPDHAPAALVVLGVRADFEARCADYPPLASAVQDRYLVTAMTERQLRMAITEPAKTAGSRVDEDLVEVLLAEVRARQPGVAGAGVLPLLSHALDQAWRSRTGQGLTVADYERTGGIEGAVADSAQRAYDHLTPGQQAAARQVFTRLTAASSDGLDTADRAARTELIEGKSPDGAGDIEAVLEAFAAERLLTLAADSVEISHEVLLTAWPLLRDTWLAETHADRIVRTRLHNTAAEWARHSRDQSYLYRGTLLDAAAQSAVRTSADPAHNPPLSQAERDFLHASDRARHRTARWRRGAIAGLAVLTLIAITTAGIAAHNAANATQQAAEAAQARAIALSRQLAAESLVADPSDPVTARQLAVAAWRVYPTDQASSAMVTLLTEQQQDGTLPITDVNGVAFSPDGKLLATADSDGTVRLWNPATGQAISAALRVDPGSLNGVNGVAFSPDGKLLATADSDGTVSLWNPATGRPAASPLHADASGIGGVLGVAFSSNGTLLASADADGVVRLWDPATGRPAGSITPANFDGGLEEVAFSPDGKLATADGDDTAQLWNATTGRPIGTTLTTSNSGDTAGVAFSPDGKLLASADTVGTVQLWNPAAGRRVGILPVGLDGGVQAVAFSPDGKLLASADTSGMVQVWDLVTGRAVGVPFPADTGSQGGVNEVAFSPDGTLLASADNDGTVRLWRPASGLTVAEPLPSADDSGVNGVAFSRDGTLLATDYSDGTVRLWNRTTGQAVAVLPPTDTSKDGGGNGVAFSPDGALLATAGNDGTVQLWNPASGRRVGAPLLASNGGAVAEVAFSPDGKLLASAAGDGTIRLWNSATGRPLGVPLRADVGQGVAGVAFSPDGKLPASADGDGTVRLWDPATGHPVGAPLPAGIGGPATQVAFSPDGMVLAAIGANGTVRLWDASLFANPYAALCTDVGPPTRQEWDQDASGNPLPKICA